MAGFAVEGGGGDHKVYLVRSPPTTSLLHSVVVGGVWGSPVGDPSGGSMGVERNFGKQESVCGICSCLGMAMHC